MKKELALFLCASLTLVAGCSSGDVVIDDFESGTFNKWTITGDAFGTAPAQGAYPNQQDVTGFEGKYLANSYREGTARKER